jgi:hypothetical protein
MDLDRRRFLKLAALSLPALAGGNWVTDALRRAERASATGSAGIAVGEHGGWSRLDRLVGLGQEIVHAILLPSGRVLIEGGIRVVDDEYPAPVLFSFDPTSPSATSSLRPVPVPLDRPVDSLFCGGHTYLADGRLLFVGGGRTHPESGLRYSMLFDPRGGRWTRIPYEMPGGLSWYATASRLPDARVVISYGFFDWGGSPNRSVELFDPNALDAGSNPWSRLISHRENRWTIEPTGEDYSHVFPLRRPIVVRRRVRHVAIIGRTGAVHLMSHTGSFDDANQRFVVRPGGRRPGTAASGGHWASGVALPDGRIMEVGGSSNRTIRQRADIYDPVADTWQSIDTGIGRLFPTAILLPDGTVLVVNGERAGTGDPRAATIIDPTTGRVTTGPPWPDGMARGYHNVALLLPDGRVLTAGGGRADLRYFLPPYLSRPALRPRITSAPRTMSSGGRYPIQYTNGPVHRVTLLSLGAVTHFFDQNQGFAELFDGESTDGSLIVEGPDPSAAPPGPYLLFLLRRTEDAGATMDVPSVGRFVRLGLPAGSRAA